VEHFRRDGKSKSPYSYHLAAVFGASRMAKNGLSADHGLGRGLARVPSGRVSGRRVFDQPRPGRRDVRQPERTVGPTAGNGDGVVGQPQGSASAFLPQPQISGSSLGSLLIPLVRLPWCGRGRRGLLLGAYPRRERLILLEK